MGLHIDYLDFDPTTPTASSRLGSFIIGKTNKVVTSTTIGSNEALDVNIVGAAAAGIYAEDSAANNADVGASILTVRQDTLGTSSSADGDYQNAKSNGKGEIYVRDGDSIAQLVLIKTDTASIVTNTGSIDTRLSNVLKAEDAVHSSGDLGIAALVKRTDVPAQSAGTDGDYSIAINDNKGRLHVNAGHNVAWKMSNATIGLTASLIVSVPLSGRKTVLLQNTNLISIFIGEQNTVTTSGATKGLEIPARSSLEFSFGDNLGVYAIAGLAAQSLGVLEAA